MSPDPPVTDRRAVRRPAPAGLRPLALAHAAVAAAGAAGFALAPDGLPRALLLVALLCWAAFVVCRATALLRPLRGAASWTALGLAQLLNAAGWVAWLLLPELGRPVPTWTGDVLFLSSYVLAVGGLLALGGLRRHRDRLAALDTAVLAVALGVLVWALVGSSLGDLELPASVTAVTVAYPALDLLLLAFVLRLLLAGSTDLRTGLLLAWATTQARRRRRLVVARAGARARPDLRGAGGLPRQQRPAGARGHRRTGRAAPHRPPLVVLPRPGRRARRRAAPARAPRRAGGAGLGRRRRRRGGRVGGGDEPGGGPGAARDLGAVGARAPGRRPSASSPASSCWPCSPSAASPPSPSRSRTPPWTRRSPTACG